MAKETHIKTDKKPVGGWGAWELRLSNYLCIFKFQDRQGILSKAGFSISLLNY
jgi:hypothetical protein